MGELNRNEVMDLLYTMAHPVGILGSVKILYPVAMKPEHPVPHVAHSRALLSLAAPQDTMSDKSDLKAELERKKQRLAQIREEKKRKEEERKKKEVRKKVSTFTIWHSYCYIPVYILCLLVCSLSGHGTQRAEIVCVHGCMHTCMCALKLGVGGA